MVDFCSRNSLVVMNTMFKQHARRLYTWKSPDKITRNQIDYILCIGQSESVIETAEKWIPKVKKRKITKWLTE